MHKSCLEKWLSSSNTSYCELCHTEFSIERRPRPLTEVTKVNALCLVCINLSAFIYLGWAAVCERLCIYKCVKKKYSFPHLSACLLACCYSVSFQFLIDVRSLCRSASPLPLLYILPHLCLCLFLLLLPQWLRDPGPRNEKRTLFCDMVCFLFITPLAAISGWLCLRGAQDHLQLGSWLQAVGLIALTIALFTIYVLWTLVRINAHTD